MRRIVLFLFLILFTFSIFLVACSNGETKPEEPIQLTDDEQIEIAGARSECSEEQSLDSLLDIYWDNQKFEKCIEGKLSWGTESRYKQFKAQQKVKSQQASELYQKQSDVDEAISNMEAKSQKGIEIKLDDYWNLDKLNEFKLQLNAKLELPVDKISTTESKEDDIRVFLLFWKKEDVLNSQEQIKADFISSLRKAVQEIKNTGEFELVVVSVVEGEKDVGNLQINIFKVNENTDYSQAVTSGSGIFNR